MKRWMIFLGIFFFISMPDTFASTWQKAVSQVNAEIKQMQADANAVKKIIADEKKELKQNLYGLNESVAQEEKNLEALKDEFETLLQTEEKLRQEIEAQKDQTRALAEVLRTAAKDVETLTENSPASPEYFEFLEKLPPLLDTKRFPAMEDIENLAEILFQEIKSSGEVRKRTGTFIDENGNETQGEILRVGKFTSFYKHGERIGYLRFDRESRKPAAIPGKLPGSVRRDIEKYFAQESENLPLDLSGGVIVEQMNQSGSIKDWLGSGGILVWPIFLIAAVSLLIALERLWSLGRIPVQTDKIMNKLRDLASQGDMNACKELCKNRPNVPTCNVLHAGLQYQGADKEVLENVLEESVLKELPRLERFLTTLSVLGAIAPLLGLLGTVTGMIHTFQGITLFGTSDPRMMSGGISEALITTQLGLAVAIPIMIAHHFFDRRVEKIIGDMEEKGTALITTLLNI